MLSTRRVCVHNNRPFVHTLVLETGTYEEEILFRRASSIITQHDPSTPLFMYYAFHIVHAPLEVTEEWLDKYDFIKDSDTRKTYHAMVGYMDNVVGKVTNLTKTRGMWDNLLIVSSSDNGGPIYAGGGANNYPLKVCALGTHGLSHSSVAHTRRLQLLSGDEINLTWCLCCVILPL